MEAEFIRCKSTPLEFETLIPPYLCHIIACKSTPLEFETRTV